MRGNLSEVTARVAQPHIYVVHRAGPGFTKVGFAVDARRWRPYLRRGGSLLRLIHPTSRHASVVEDDLHNAIRAAGISRAFSAKSDAATYLGHNGAGWTECYGDPTGTAVLILIGDVL